MIKCFKITCLAILIMFACNYSFTYASAVDPIQNPGSGTVDTGVKTSTGKVWGLVNMIFQIAAISTLLACGVKYMLTSAEGKAEVKKMLLPIVVGVLLVYGSYAVIEIVRAIFNDISGTRGSFS